MQAWEAIQRVVDVIETDDLSIEELAGVACLSPFYFQRLFARLVGRPAGEYARLRKLARASELLTDTDMRILDIAMQFGFSDHANFTRAFREAYGLSPEEYRSHPVRLNHCMKADVSVQHTSLEEGVALIADDMVVQVNRRKLEKPRTFYGIEGILARLRPFGWKRDRHFCCSPALGGVSPGMSNEKNRDRCPVYETGKGCLCHIFRGE